MTSKIQPGDVANETSLVTGAVFREFYKHHWPADFYVEIDDATYDMEDELGNFIMPADKIVRLDDLGTVGLNRHVDGLDRSALMPMHWLWNRVMADVDPSVIVSFRVDPDKLENLVAFAKDLGAQRVGK